MKNNEPRIHSCAYSSDSQVYWGTQIFAPVIISHHNFAVRVAKLLPNFASKFGMMHPNFEFCVRFSKSYPNFPNFARVPGTWYPVPGVPRYPGTRVHSICISGYNCMRIQLYIIKPPSSEASSTIVVVPLETLQLYTGTICCT